MPNDNPVIKMIEEIMPTTKAKRAVEQESIAPQPFPRLHLFLVTPDGVPVGELRFDPLDTQDSRFADAVLDVDRFTERMTHMNRAELNGLQNRLSGIQGRVQEFLSRPNTENGNGNGNGVHANVKPTEAPTPPSEPVPPAEQAEPVTPPATPVPASAATPATRRRRNAGTPNRRNAPAAGEISGLERVTNAVAAVREREAETLAAALQQEAESEMLAQGTPTITTTPTAAAPQTGGLGTLFGGDTPAPTPAPAPAAPAPLPAPVVTSAPTPTTVDATGRPATTPPSSPARASEAGRSAHSRRRPAVVPPSPAPTATPTTTTTPAPASAPSPAPNAQAPANPQAALEAKILATVTDNAPLGLSFGQIRDRVNSNTPDVFVSIKRLIDAGKLRKEGTLYRLP